ncbi:hypothetical protein C8R45DRAFT_1081188, partial [Mycena sanguinolenta]
MLRRPSAADGRRLALVVVPSIQLDLVPHCARRLLHRDARHTRVLPVAVDPQSPLARLSHGFCALAAQRRPHIAWLDNHMPAAPSPSRKKRIAARNTVSIPSPSRPRAPALAPAFAAQAEAGRRGTRLARRPEDV